MTDVSTATPGPLPPPPPRSHGCLWGCLIAALIAIAAIVGLVTFSGWWLSTGYKDSGTLKAAIAEINNDQTARAVLGDHIEITSLGSSSYSTDVTSGTVESYDAHVKGSKAAGSLVIYSQTPPGGARHFSKLILTGPDGRSYDLTHGDPGPSPGAI